MVTYDPRVLIPRLYTLLEDVERVTQTASETIRQAEHTQRCAIERVSRMRRWQSIIDNQLSVDLEMLHRVENEVKKLLSQSDTAVGTAKNTLGVIEKKKQEADDLHVHWTQELELALAWLQRAENRLEQAIVAYNAATAELESAKRSFESAQRSLRNCNNDRDRKSCMMESIACGNAEGRYDRAIAVFSAAEIELGKAKEEHRQAKVRVNCCKKAVELTTQAVSHSEFALDQSEQAISAAERSLESGESADRATAKAHIHATEANEEADNLRRSVRKAKELTEEARGQAERARTAADSAYCLSTQGKSELSYRVQQLIQLNRTSLPTGSTSATTSADVLPGRGSIDPLASFSFEKDTHYSNDGVWRFHAKDSDGNPIGDITARRTDDGNVHIKDTNVAKAFRRKGIGSKLVDTFEQDLPAGTEVFFFENGNPGFWKAKGYTCEEIIRAPGETGPKYRYFKRISKN